MEVNLKTMKAMHMKTKTKASGFFIVEILIVLLIVGILAIALLPNLTVYIKKAKFADVIAAANAAKPSVEFCLVKNMGSTDYSAVCGNNTLVGYPALSANKGNVASASPAISGTTSTAVITATGTTDVDGQTFILTGTPDATNNVVVWTSGGTCVANGLC